MKVPHPNSSPKWKIWLSCSWLRGLWGPRPWTCILFKLNLSPVFLLEHPIGSNIAIWLWLSLFWAWGNLDFLCDYMWPDLVFSFFNSLGNSWNLTLFVRSIFDWKRSLEEGFYCLFYLFCGCIFWLRKWFFGCDLVFGLSFVLEEFEPFFEIFLLFFLGFVLIVWSGRGFWSWVKICFLWSCILKLFYYLILCHWFFSDLIPNIFFEPSIFIILLFLNNIIPIITFRFIITLRISLFNFLLINYLFLLIIISLLLRCIKIFKLNIIHALNVFFEFFV